MHHGIKGQKWGVRRYQNKDGSLTPAGEKRYDDSNQSSKKKSKYRINLENKYIAKGLTRENAEKAANDKIRTQKTLAVIAGVTVAAAAAYLVTKHVKERTDQIVKADSTFQRIESQKKIFGSKNRNLHDSFYVTNNAYDNKNYADAFGNQKKNYYGKAYKLNIKATSDIKIASQRKAQDTLVDLMRNDKTFQSNASVSDFTRDLRGNHRVPQKYVDQIKDGKKVPRHIIRRIYDNYNSNLVGKPIDKIEDTSRKTFYNALKKQGYGGIQDINDLKWSNLRGKNPLIIFDKSKTKVDEIVDITKNMSNSKENKAYDRMSILAGAQAAHKAIPKVAALSVASLASTFLPNSKRHVKALFVKQYKQKHPNTKLSKQEIERMYDNRNK
jgi:hypothetical protein